MKCRSVLAAVLSLTMLLPMLTACGCEHEYEAATCIAPATCSLCGAQDGEPSGKHKFKSATCIAPKTCLVCGETKGKKAEHTPDIPHAVCTRDSKCTECGKVLETNGDHVYAVATCTKGPVCTICNQVQPGGQPRGHIFSNGYCGRCKAQDPNYRADAEIIQALADIGNDVTMLGYAAATIPPAIELHNINGEARNILSIQDAIQTIYDCASDAYEVIEPFENTVYPLYLALKDFLDYPIYTGNDRSYLTEVKTYIRNVEELAIVYEATVNQYVE